MPQSDWAVVWLAVAGVSLAVMALIQIGAILALLKVVREGLETVRGVQKQLAPLVDRGQVLLASTTDAVHQAQGVVHQAQAVMLRVSAQVERAEDVASAASEKVADLRRTVRPVTANVAGTVAGVRAFWAGLQGRDRVRPDREETPPPHETTARFDEGVASPVAVVR